MPLRRDRRAPYSPDGNIVDSSHRVAGSHVEWRDPERPRSEGPINQFSGDFFESSAAAISLNVRTRRSAGHGFRVRFFCDNNR